MIDLHTHSLLSDGCLLPSELVARAAEKGYKVIAITDHVDTSNYASVIKNLVQVSEDLNKNQKVLVIPGAEISYVLPEQLPDFVKAVKKLGAKLIVVHGETIVEPVIPGTNRIAIEIGADILAHPGLITLEDARLAGKNDVCLEITTRRGHCYTNGHVAKMAGLSGAKLVLNTDSHGPDDLMEKKKAELIARGAGLSEEEIKILWQNSQDLIDRVEGR